MGVKRKELTLEEAFEILEETAARLEAEDITLEDACFNLSRGDNPFSLSINTSNRCLFAVRASSIAFSIRSSNFKA